MKKKEDFDYSHAIISSSPINIESNETKIIHINKDN